jgi:hypothetical protein
MTAKTKISAALLAALALVSAAGAQSPGAIATASRVVAARQESCRAQAEQQKLGYFKRRACMKK